MNDYIIVKRIAEFIASLRELYRCREDIEALEAVSFGFDIQEDAREDFNDIGHNLVFYVPASEYIKIETKKSELCQKIRSDINQHITAGIAGEFINNVDICIGAAKNDLINEPLQGINKSELINSETIQRIWETQRGIRVFISHRTTHKLDATKLKQELSLWGINCFVAHKDIDVSEEWRSEILFALNSMHAFAALITDDYHGSDWTDQELGFALAKGVPIFPLLSGGKSYGFIDAKQHIELDWNTISQIMIDKLSNYHEYIYSFISAIGKCTSFDTASDLYKNLPQYRSMSHDEINLMIVAYNSNNYIRNNYYFNGKAPTSNNGFIRYINALSKPYVYTYDSNHMIIEDVPF